MPEGIPDRHFPVYHNPWRARRALMLGSDISRDHRQTSGRVRHKLQVDERGLDRAGAQLGIIPAVRDISTFIPVVSLFIALTLNIRRFGVTMARFLVEMTKKVRERNIEKGRAEDRAWNKRRMEAEARDEPFDEPFPGDEGISGE